jgi:secreted trypsin-like serine protease
LALAVFLIASYQPSAEAIIINDAVGGAGALALGAPHLGVVNITQGGVNWCSGSLIDSTHILTAQHCTTGEAATNFTINFYGNDGTTVAGTRAVTAKAEMPGYSSFYDGLDVAILTMGSAAPSGFNPLKLWHRDRTGSQATTVGFGLQGLGSIGYYGNFYTDYANYPNWQYDTRWAAENVIDYFGDPLGLGYIYAYTAQSNIFSADFDGPLAGNPLAFKGSSPTALGNEGILCFGDSGGPLLVSGIIAGVNNGIVWGAGNDPVCEEGNLNFWTGTFASNVRSFITSNSEATYIPEPSTFVLVMLGVGVLGVQGRREKLRFSG